MKPDTDDVWQEQRWYWRNRDLPALAGERGVKFIAPEAA